MQDWADGPLVREYSLSSDWDDRWRTGGSVAEVIGDGFDPEVVTRVARLVDGADAARFLVTIKERLEEGAFETELGL